MKREIPDEEEDVIALPRSEFDSVSMSDAHDSESGADGEEVDTALLVRKVKDRLHLHGISQRVSIFIFLATIIMLIEVYLLRSSCLARQCWESRLEDVPNCFCVLDAGPRSL